MTIAQICPCPFPSLGGPARSYIDFSLVTRGSAIGWVRPRHGQAEKPVLPLACEVPVLDWAGLGYYHYASQQSLKEAEEVVKQADCVIVHGFFLYPEIWTMRICRQLKKPYLIVAHGIFDPWAMKKTRVVKSLWTRLYGREVLDHAAGIICATEAEQKKSADFVGSVPSFVINWPVELPDLTEARSRRSEIRNRFGFSDEDRVLIYFGRLHSMKRPLETLRSLAGLSLERLRLLVVGPDGNVTAASLQAEANRLGWEGTRIVGPVWGQEKYAYLCAADGYVSLSHRENFNYTLAEAMGCGLPPILSPGNDLGWAFESLGFSWQLTTQADSELRSAVQEFVTLPSEVLRARGEAARFWVETQLGRARFGDGVNRLVSQVVGSKRIRG